jgi:hypothetical protein
MRIPALFTSILSCLALTAAAQLCAADILVDASQGRLPVSPLLYGRNNSLSDDSNRPLKAADWQLLKDAGVTMFRECGGNNSTKYNWKLKLSSHPDWYNNVYPHDWDYTAKSLQQNIPGAKAMFGFQLIGWAAGTMKYNFDAGAFNNHQWSPAVNSNWAGGGGPGRKEGDPKLYLVPWSAADTTGILDHWIGPKGIGIDSAMVRYWDMDNEPEIWSGTHNDIMKTPISAEEFVRKYIDVAKKARALFPGIKLLGPVTCNEWQWYNWNNDKVKTPEGDFVWIEYFIKRIAEEQKKSGIRLLDVVDLHWYPGERKPEAILQLHRGWFDTNYAYPGANGVKRVGPSGWNNDSNKEYIFLRCRQWLDRYMGPGHGVTLGVSEMGIEGDDPTVTALWYASTLGVFMDEGVEVFTPWTWKKGMWEVLHLFSRYNQPVRVASSSKGEPMVSSYATVSEDGKAMTVVLVNRAPEARKNLKVELANFAVKNGAYRTLTLANLPKDETFKSHEDNALVKGKVKVAKSKMALTLPARSITTILLK